MNEVSIKNLRLTRQKFRAYLNKKYNSRLGEKLTLLFDWSNALDYV